MTGSQSESDSTPELFTLIQDAVDSLSLQTLVLSRPATASSIYHRIDVRPVQLQSGLHYQLTSSTRTQQFHRNVLPSDLSDELRSLIGQAFRDVRLVTAAACWEARFSKKSRCVLRRLPSPAGSPSLHAESSRAITKSTEDTAPNSTVQPHNRQRQYLIPDGVPCPFLISSGVMTSEGQVRAKQYHKFRQINRYLEFIQDLLPEFSDCETLRIIDFGCGKSYLTFATHYLLTAIHGRRCRITGLDRRPDVVETCRRITSELQLENLEFHVGNIADYTPSTSVDLVISLHACDTATDDAIAQAVAWKSRVILAVPCCQHELAAKLPADSLPVLTNHGVLRDRFAALATDAIRAAVLNTMGYDAAVMEFIDMEHTPKNLLIRAIRRTTPENDEQREISIQQLESFHKLLNVKSLQLQQLLANT